MGRLTGSGEISGPWHGRAKGEYFMLRRSTSCIIGNMRAKEGPGKGEDSSS